MGMTPGPVDEAPVLYFRVDDIATYTARVRELGGEVVSETTYDSGPNAVCRDDQGREFQLWQPAPGTERPALASAASGDVRGPVRRTADVHAETSRL